jgi:hypothetical protein
MILVDAIESLQRSTTAMSILQIKHIRYFCQIPVACLEYQKWPSRHSRGRKAISVVLNLTGTAAIKVPLIDSEVPATYG